MGSDSSSRWIVANQELITWLSTIRRSAKFPRSLQVWALFLNRLTDIEIDVTQKLAYLILEIEEARSNRGAFAAGHNKYLCDFHE
jgi:hypothetical protein